MRTRHRAFLLLVLSVICVTMFIASSVVVDAQARSAPNISGNWNSLTCETRPAGNGTNLYVKRNFIETRTASEAKLLFYSDAACTLPTLTVIVDGPYVLGQASTTVPGATDGVFSFTTATLTPHTEAAVALLNSAVPTTCGTKRWHINSMQNIFVTGGCSVLGLNFKTCPKEYDLVKLDTDKDLLYFGARPSDGGGLCTPQRRPTALQPPLVRSLIPTIRGRWVSLTCEMRPGGNGTKQYLTRDFREAQTHSAATLHFFADSACIQPFLTAFVDGPYIFGPLSTIVLGAVQADFPFTNATITPNSETAVNLLNSAAPHTCGTAKWKINTPQNIFITGGCSVLGLNFQTCPQEYDLVKLDAEKDLLYFGARPSNGGGLCTPQQRPTALQVPLKQVE